MTSKKPQDPASLLARCQPFPLKQLAAQAGVSKATVDRAVHQRGGVHPQTLRRIEQALGELEGQALKGLAAGRRFHVDVIMHTPQRFSAAVRRAIESQLGSLPPFRIAPRFYVFEELEPAAMSRLLLECRERGSQGVILKAADDPQVRAAVGALAAAGIPVVTLVTDLPGSARLGYVGMDNHAAGRTAAYLLSNWLCGESRAVGVVIGSLLFRGEEEREIGFREGLRTLGMSLAIIEISGGLGVYEHTFERVAQALAQDPQLTAIYSVGGGNRAVVDAFAAAGRPLTLFICHDLDEENRQLLEEGHATALINHDLSSTCRGAFVRILGHHGFMSDTPTGQCSIQIVTPFNLPNGSLSV